MKNQKGNKRNKKKIKRKKKKTPFKGKSTYKSEFTPQKMAKRVEIFNEIEIEKKPKFKGKTIYETDYSPERKNYIKKEKMVKIKKSRRGARKKVEKQPKKVQAEIEMYRYHKEAKESEIQLAQCAKMRQPSVQ